MKGRRLALALALGGAAAVIAAACSFPDVTFENGNDDGSTPDSNPFNPGDTSVGDAGPGGDATHDSDVDPDGGSQEASVYDAAGKVDASGCTTCDCDGDGFNLKDGATCTGGPTTGFDCDDTDKSINQGVTDFVVSTVWPSSVWSPAYDWNCDGTVTKQFAYNVSCGAISIGTDCTAISGFSGAPECGASGEFITCKSAGLGCAIDSSRTTTMRQGCK